MYFSHSRKNFRRCFDIGIDGIQQCNIYFLTNSSAIPINKIHNNSRGKICGTVMLCNGRRRLNGVCVMNTSHIHGNTFCLCCKRADWLILIRSCFPIIGIIGIIGIRSINNIRFAITKSQRLHITRFCTYTNDVIESKQFCQNFCPFCCGNVQNDTLFPTIQVIEIQAITFIDKFPTSRFVPAIRPLNFCHFRTIG